MARLGLLTSGLGAVAVLFLCAQLAARGGRRVALVQQGRLQALGEDADWDVKRWSAQHKHAVASSTVDRTTVRNIWAGKDKAWAGIDSVLPTGGQYGYEEDHLHTADEAQLLHYVGYAEGELRKMAAALPAKVPARLEKEVAQARDAIAQEEAAFAAVAHEVGGGEGAFRKGAAAPQMLAQAPGGRVFEDEALYGEGIAGDIRSQGHHEARWNAKGAQKDMNAYFSKLSVAAEQEAQAAHGGRGPWVATDQSMDAYFKKLVQDGAAWNAHHAHTLKADHYYQMHPFEHRDMKKFIRDSFAGKAQVYNPVYTAYKSGKAAPPSLTAVPTEDIVRGGGGGAAQQKLRGAVAGLPVEIEKVWAGKHGVPRSAADKRAFAHFAKHAVRVADAAAGAAVEALV